MVSKWFFLIGMSVSFLWGDKVAHIDVKGMTCPLCTVAIKRSLKKTPGVVSAKVRLNTHSATVRFRDDVNVSTLLKAIEKVGYKGKIVRIERAEKR